MSIVGTLYDVHYKDKSGNKQNVTYFAADTYEAERLSRSEPCIGEEFIKVVKSK